MAKNFILFSILLCFQFVGQAQFGGQYLGVRARYSATRLVNDDPNPPKRENRLILSFYRVSAEGFYTPVSLSNYDIWVYPAGFQYGSLTGGVIDSSGNNYPGYSFTAPKAVAYYNSFLPNAIDCNPNAATRFTVNGHELDCGFITVSHWDIDYGNGQPIEVFNAPNVCLEYFHAGHVFANSPGNVNFEWPVFPTAPYNWYSNNCNGIQQVVIRGVLPMDTAHTLIPLPVKLVNGMAERMDANTVLVKWSNLTESDIARYEVERSFDGTTFSLAGIVFPALNNGGRADYSFTDATAGATRVLYRIKAVENTGSVIYGALMAVPAVSFSVTEPRLSVFPNPVNGTSFTVQCDRLQRGIYTVSVSNAAGQMILTKKIDHSGGVFSQSIASIGFVRGLYHLSLYSDAITLTQKIIIQ